MTQLLQVAAAGGQRAGFGCAPKGPVTCGGAKGTRTPNPLLAKQVRYQLRHGPRRVKPAEKGCSGPADGVGRLCPELLLAMVRLSLPPRENGRGGRKRDDDDLLHRRGPSCLGGRPPPTKGQR